MVAYGAGFAFTTVMNTMEWVIVGIQTAAQRLASALVTTRKATVARDVFHGEHGYEDPDTFQPVSVGVTRNFPAMLVRADPDGAVLSVARLRTELGIDEITRLIEALEEARTYLEEHQ